MDKTKVISNKLLNTYLESIINIIHDEKIDKKIKHKTINRIFKELKNEIQPYFPYLHIKASAGAGNLAEVPWITFSDPTITKGASKGYYVVILFDSFRKGIVCQLCYAWTPFKIKYKSRKGLIITEKVSASVRKTIAEEYDVASFDKTIKSIGNGQLAKGYIAGSIIGKYIPIEELALNGVVKALKDLLIFYKFMINNVVGTIDIESVLNNVESTGDFVKAAEKSEKEYFKNLNIEQIGVHNGYDSARAGIRNDSNRPPIARDSYKQNRKSQSKIGDQGEKIVELFENYGLRRTNYKARILTTDGDGYDIASFETNGISKFIEVKSTKVQTSKITFYISQNELDKARDLNNYYLYVVTGVGSSNPQIYKFKQPFGKNKKNDYKEFRLEATNYKVTINLKN